MIIPEILAAGGLIPQTSDEVAWFKTGVIPPAGNYGRFWCDPYALFFIEVIAFQFAELRRWQDYKKPGSMGKQYFLGFEKLLGGSGNPSYPGKQSSLIWHVRCRFIHAQDGLLCMQLCASQQNDDSRLLPCLFDVLHVHGCLLRTVSCELVYMCQCNEVSLHIMHIKMLFSIKVGSVVKLRTL